MRQMSNDQIEKEAFSVLQTVYSGATKPLRATTTAWEDRPLCVRKLFLREAHEETDSAIRGNENCTKKSFLLKRLGIVVQGQR